MSSVIYRPGTADDLPFLISTFCAYYRQLNKTEALHAVMLILTNPEIEVTVADMDNLILGYTVTQDDLIHYVYVKHSYRRSGLARALVKHATGRYTPVIAARPPQKKQLAAHFIYLEQTNVWLKK